MPDVRSGRPGLWAAGLSGVALLLSLLSPLAAQAADALKDWPCKEPLVAPLTAAMVWPAGHGRLPDALPPDRAWEADPPVRAVVEYAASPENSAGFGGDAIARLASEPGRDRQATLTLALSGVVDLTNRLRAIMVDGIGVNVARSHVLADVIDASAAEPPATTDPAEIRQARFWNLRRLDKAEDDARMLCRRIAYTERKLRALAEAISNAME